MMPFTFAGVMYLLSGIFCVAVQCVEHKNTASAVELIINESFEVDSKQTAKPHEQPCPWHNLYICAKCQDHVD